MKELFFKFSIPLSVQLPDHPKGWADLFVGAGLPDGVSITKLKPRDLAPVEVICSCFTTMDYKGESDIVGNTHWWRCPSCKNIIVLEFRPEG